MNKDDTAVRATGGCLCGAVRYIVRGPLRKVIACHCTECRRMSGHHFAATAARHGDLDITGEEALTWYRASDKAMRGFCGTCGSTLFWRSDSADYTSILAGSLNSPTGLKLSAHIFVGEKGDYYDIADGVPQVGDGSHGIRFPDG